MYAQELWERQITSCNELLAIEEAEWPHQSQLWCKRRLGDPTWVDHIPKLIALDAKRRDFYADLQSRFVVEDRLKSAADFSSLNLANLQLTVLPGARWEWAKITVVDLSENRLKSLQPLRFAVGLRTLKVAKNLLRDLRGLAAIADLEILDAAQNLLESAVEIAKEFERLGSLKKVILTGNPALAADFAILKSALPAKCDFVFL